MLFITNSILLPGLWTQSCRARLRRCRLRISFTGRGIKIAALRSGSRLWRRGLSSVVLRVFVVLHLYNLQTSSVCRWQFEKGNTEIPGFVPPKSDQDLITKNKPDQTKVTSSPVWLHPGHCLTGLKNKNLPFKDLAAKNNWFGWCVGVRQVFCTNGNMSSHRGQQ